MERKNELDEAYFSSMRNEWPEREEMLLSLLKYIDCAPWGTLILEASIPGGD